MINLIVNPTHFSGNSETLIDPILVTDSIRVIDSNTIPIDRSISNHDGTYVSIHSAMTITIHLLEKFGRCYQKSVLD
jgi:hypothetical protein